MTQLHLIKLVIPPAATRAERLAQLQDEIDKAIVAHKFHDWADSRDINISNWTINYPDGAMISMNEPTFTCLVGNQEIQVDTLEEAEEWLWENFSAEHYYKEEKASTKLAGFNAGFKPRRFSTSESLHAGMCLHSIPMGDTCVECAEMAND